MTKLGIHTKVDDPSQPHKTHAWLSTEKDGVTKTYSLYDDGNENASYNGQERGWNSSGTHVRENVDLDKTPTASRFKDISPDQEKKFKEALGEPQKFGTFHNNCSHFASKTWEHTTGERLDVKHQALGSHGQSLSAESPVGLEQSIRSRDREHAPEKPPAPESRTDSAPAAPEPRRKSLSDYQRSDERAGERQQQADEKRPSERPSDRFNRSNDLSDDRSSR